MPFFIPPLTYAAYTALAAIAVTVLSGCSKKEPEKNTGTTSPDPKDASPSPPKSSANRPLQKCVVNIESTHYQKAPACNMDESNQVTFSTGNWASWSMFCNVSLGKNESTNLNYPLRDKNTGKFSQTSQARSIHSWADHDQDGKVDMIRIVDTIIVVNEKYRNENHSFGKRQGYVRSQAANPQEIHMAQQGFDYLMKPAGALLAGFLETLKTDQVRVKPWRGEEPFILLFKKKGETQEAWLRPHDTKWETKDISKIPPKRIGYSIDLAHQKLEGEYHASDFSVNLSQHSPQLKPFHDKLVGFIQESVKNKKADFQQTVFEDFKTALKKGGICIHPMTFVDGTKEIQFRFNMEGKDQVVQLVADEDGKVIELHFLVYFNTEIIRDPELLLPIQNQLNILQKEAERELAKLTNH